MSASAPELVNEHERMLTGGFYAEISLNYDASIAQESSGRPFGIEFLREIQLSKRDVLDSLTEARTNFTTDEWKEFLLRSVGSGLLCILVKIILNMRRKS